MRVHPLSTSFPEKRDIAHMWFPKENYLEFTSFFLGLLLLLTFSFLLSPFLFFDVLYRYVIRVSVNTRMRWIDTYVAYEQEQARMLEFNTHQ